MVPEKIKEVLHNDTVYRDYLLKKKWRELSIADENNNYALRLEQNLRVSEPDLVMLIWMRIKNQIKRVTTSTTTTTPRYEESERGKGQFFRGASGKCYPKNQQTIDENSSEKLNQSDSMSSSITSCYGYIVVSNNFEVSFFSEHKNSSLEAVNDAFSKT